ncbi:hypothetical protein PG985_013020 [Apiospora marii]|uniref:Uncharacterized protein n=1 Tax=Apiospora marii TaxID=335849 RepID=A0ABR1RAP9_9PEZI
MHPATLERHVTIFTTAAAFDDTNPFTPVAPCQSLWGIGDATGAAARSQWPGLADRGDATAESASGDSDGALPLTDWAAFSFFPCLNFSPLFGCGRPWIRQDVSPPLPPVNGSRCGANSFFGSDPPQAGRKGG